ncbi:translation initiation factor eIF2B subunit delta-like [Babylonia areolata]|uniref:translation initiation factor eIF2B subunit delta-like n=1 Tax=Babylonia areolata TaxID=304850 RepID=UPI003FCFA934
MAPQTERRERRPRTKQRTLPLLRKGRSLMPLQWERGRHLPPTLSPRRHRRRRPTPIRATATRLMVPIRLTVPKNQKRRRRRRAKVRVKDRVKVKVTRRAPRQAGAPQKTKAELKAERRALQEAQRAAKSAKKDGAQASAAQVKGGGGDPPRVPAKVLGDDPSTQKKEDKKLAKQNVPQRASSSKKVAFFSHLRQYDPELKIISELQAWEYREAGKVQGIHPQIKTVGLQFADYTLVGSSCRATALLAAMQAVIKDYKTPKDKDLCRDLDAHIKRLIAFINQCRPLSVSMGNAIKFLKWKISHIPPSMPELEAKRVLTESIDKFVREKIIKASDAIALFASKHITKGEYIIVFGFSFVVLRVLLNAKHRDTLTVLVVDNRPRHEGRAMLRRLREAGIRCIFVTFNLAPFYIRGLTQPGSQRRHKIKLLLGAHGVLNNGYVMSRIGAAMLASTAKAHGIPVVVCHETYKISERSQTDSFVFNELGDPNEVIQLGHQVAIVPQWMDKRSLTVLNLMYDVTANSDVTMFVTEIGSMSDTSIPKVLSSRATLYET